MRRLLAGPLVALAIGAISTLRGTNIGQAAGPRVTVKPEIGSPRASFVISFTVRAGAGPTVLRYEVTASAHSARGCSSRAFAFARVPPRGTPVRVTLTPGSTSHWCRGTYHGELKALTSAVCANGTPCRRYVAILTIARFEFLVRGLGHGHFAPLRFAGLRTAATTCTSGSTGSGQKTSYRLDWAAAIDPSFSSSRIVYDIYVAHVSGGEDFSVPTWTTRPGVSDYTTPDIVLGSNYFVVRARDPAGHEDQNRVERRGIQQCAYPGATTTGWTRVRLRTLRGTPAVS
jgi:hypothetical protein